MSTVTLRPNDDLYEGSIANTVGPAASREDALSDDDDDTYVTIYGQYNGYLGLALDTATIPAGAVTRTLTVRARGNPQGFTLNAEVYYQGDFYVTPPLAYLNAFGAPGLDDFVGPSFAMNLSQTEIDGLRMIVSTPEQPFLLAFCDVMELYVDVVFAEQPTVEVTAPTGTVTATSSPVATWEHTPGDDGGAQSRFELAVFSATQYGIGGGFDPATSPATYRPGVQLGASSSWVIGPLSDATTYRTYVRTAQTINGQPHWSDWDYEQFDTDFALPEIASVVAVGDAENGRMVIVVEQAADTPDEWETLTVERSSDGGDTWSFVRGATDMEAPAGDLWTGYDYEAPNGAPMLYRARSATATFTGEWVESESAIWSSSEAWLKDPAHPGLNRVVEITNMPVPTRSRRRGVHDVIGRAAPVVTSDVRLTRRGDFTVRTDTADQADSLLALVDGTVQLLQVPAAQGGAFEMYIGITDVDEDRLARDANGFNARERLWTLPFVEVERPFDDGIDAVAELLPLTYDEAALFTYEELAELFPTYADLL